MTSETYEPIDVKAEFARIHKEQEALLDESSSFIENANIEAQRLLTQHKENGTFFKRLAWWMRGKDKTKCNT